MRKLIKVSVFLLLSVALLPVAYVSAAYAYSGYTELAASATGALRPVSATSTVTAGPVITETPKIDGSKATLVYIPMGGNRKGDVVTANDNISSDENASELIKRAQGKVVAAVNGGFFASYYNASKPMAFPDNYPEIYGVIMKNGRVINGGGKTNALGFDADGKPFIDHVDIKTNIMVNKSDGLKKFTVWGVNKYYEDSDSVNMFTPDFKLPFDVNEDAKVVSIKYGEVTAIADGGCYTVPAGTSVAVFNPGAAANAKRWTSFPAVGDNAYIEYELSAKKGADWSLMTAIVAGGRMLLQSGHIVTNDDSYNAGIDGPKQASSLKSQRSFAAIMNDGRLVLGTANASFDAIAEYLKSKGAVDAVSLDGGASSMLYVEDGGFLTNSGRKLASAVVIIEK